MGLLNRIFGCSSRFGRAWLVEHDCLHPQAAWRRQFEQMEQRQMLSASPPLQFGAVYVEQDLGSDLQGDTLEVTFVGGAAHTELAQVVIDGDQFELGFGRGDVFFDSVEAGLGADHAYPLTLVSHDGIDDVTWHVEDGTTQVVFSFQGFHAGEKLVFTIDVDEVEEFDPDTGNLETLNEGIDPLTSGVEFQGSQLAARFTAPHYEDAEGSTTFVNRYDDLLADTDLPLPPDNAEGKRDRTAGAVGRLEQQPKPIGISGTVYEETNLDLVRDSGEGGIAGVTLALWRRRAAAMWTRATRRSRAAGASTSLIASWA